MKHRRTSEQLKQVIFKTEQDIKSGMKVLEACKKHKLEPSLYYVKMRQYASSNGQTSNKAIDDVQAKLLQLQQENMKLRKLVIDSLLAS